MISKNRSDGIIAGVGPEGGQQQQQEQQHVVVLLGREEASGGFCWLRMVGQA